MAHTGEPGADPARHTNMGTAMDEIAKLQMKCAELRNDKAFMAGALHEIQERSHDPEIERLAQAAIHDHEGERDGMARLEHDVVTLPPDQVALGLVESMFVRVAHLQIETSTLQGDIERLKVLLEKREAS